jgi:hypothetical protein
MVVADTNSLVTFTSNFFTTLTGGDLIILGILLMIAVIVFLVMSGTKSSTSLSIGLAMIFLIAIFASSFMALFWIIIIVAMFILINGLRKKLTGQ